LAARGQEWGGVRALAIAAFAILFPSLACAAQMTFQPTTLLSASCGGRCPQAIVANGSIEASTPSDFASAVERLDRKAGSTLTVLMNSPGGSVPAAMELGVLFRRLRVRAIVERVDASGSRGGFCASACVYAIMGAERRIAPPGSRVCLHRMSVASVGLFGVSRQVVGPELVSAVTRYAERMGVSGGLVAAAESQVPELVRVLSPSEMSNWRLVTAQAR